MATIWLNEGDRVFYDEGTPRDRTGQVMLVSESGNAVSVLLDGNRLRTTFTLRVDGRIVRRGGALKKTARGLLLDKDHK